MHRYYSMLWGSMKVYRYSLTFEGLSEAGAYTIYKSIHTDVRACYFYKTS